MEQFKILANILIGILIICVIYSAISLISLIMRLIGICMGSCS